MDRLSVIQDHLECLSFRQLIQSQFGPNKGKRTELPSQIQLGLIRFLRFLHKKIPSRGKPPPIFNTSDGLQTQNPNYLGDVSSQFQPPDNRSNPPFPSPFS